MGRREFKAHLAEAQSLPEKIKAREDVGILHLEPGELEGQLSVQYAHASLERPLSITVIIQDTSSYPTSIDYLIFLDDNIEGDIGSRVPRTLARLSTSLEDIPIDDIFPYIAERLHVQLAEGHSSEVEGQSDSDDFDDTAWSDSAEYDDIDPNESAPNRLNHAELNGSMETQKRDLTAALVAGVSVGVYDFSDTHYEIMSLSIPISNWGIDPERLEAWDLTEKDYVVLLIRTCAGGYPSTRDYLEMSRPHTVYRFVLGKCSSPKPSERSARDAVRDRSSGAEAFAGPGSSATSSGHSEFQPLHLFHSTEKTLQNDLASLIKIRMKDSSLSWSGALTFHITGEKADTTATHEEALADPKGPRILRQHALGSTDILSIPLVAMNCAVYLMVRSGQHCVNCGRPLPIGFETMRPYICQRDLCLDQYFSLNLGPGIEHEIINNPHTVDLLVGFFYSALLSNRISQFPKALRLKGPGPAIPNKPDVQATVQYQGGKGEAKLLGNMFGHEKTWLQPGAEVLLLAAAPWVPDNFLLPDDSSSSPVSLQEAKSVRRTTGRCYHHSQRLLCTVTGVCEHGFTFSVDAFWAVPGKSRRAATQPIIGPTFQPSPFIDGSEELPDQMFVLPFTQDIADLTRGERDMALFTILCGLPSILKIRKFLVQNPRQRLAESPLILDPNTYRLLLWIVASNRSFIVQDEPIPDLARANLDSVDAPNKVIGMPSGWLQFRFVQGSPEKEHRFVQELDKVHDGNASTPASLFAWHGSNLNNWHGIVSTGLNFDQTLNGRSYGHGVYFSEQFNCSLGYANQSAEPSWPNSDLRASQAISMCEIVNKRDEFVSTKPHMVVNELDWIQCRFLFARVNPTIAATDPEVCFPQGSKSAGSSASPINLDPQILKKTSILNDCQQPLQIPVSAIPSHARPRDFGPQRRKWLLLGKRTVPDSEATEPGLADDTGIDLDGVLNAGQASLSESTHLFSKRLKEDLGATDFVPGALDWTLIPKLPDPASPSAPACKILMQEIFAISKVQAETSLTDRGWFVDVEKLQELGNMFHWVVELHSFDKNLPLASDMKKKGCKSIVLELNFGSNYPMSPPFARIIRPRFLEFAQGGGGNVTQGGSICSEMLVTKGWNPTMGIEKIILQIRLQLCDMERPARLRFDKFSDSDYTVGEALEAYRRAAAAHGWSVSSDLNDMSAKLTTAGSRP